MNNNTAGVIVIIINMVSCYATYLIATKLKIWVLRLIPALLCLVGAVVCYFIYNSISSFDISSQFYPVIFGISFGLATAASLVTIGVVYVKAKWAEISKRQRK